jgi:hypothetical protein
MFRDLYNKTLQTRNVRQMDRLCSKLAPFILSVTNTIALTKTLAYYGIRTSQIHTVFVVQTQVQLLGVPRIQLP